MAYLVIKKFYKDKAGRLVLLVEGKPTDKNFWMYEKENKYNICLEDWILQVQPLVYANVIVPYNEGKKNEDRNFTKNIVKRKSFYVV